MTYLAGDTGRIVMYWADDTLGWRYRKDCDVHDL